MLVGGVIRRAQKVLTGLGQFLGVEFTEERGYQLEVVLIRFLGNPESAGFFSFLKEPQHLEFVREEVKFRGPDLLFKAVAAKVQLG